MKQILLLLLLMLMSSIAFAVIPGSPQDQVINNAMGAYMGSNSLDKLIKWTIAIGYLLWMGWMGISSFSSWADGESSIADLSYTVINAAAITMLVVWVIT